MTTDTWRRVTRTVVSTVCNFVHNITDRLSRPQLVLAGVGLGLAWGVLARLWMRLISTDPAFTWGGTMYIILAAMILGLGVGGAAAGRRSPRRWARRVTRVLGGISLIFLSVAAGIIMVASVIPATLAVFERRWWKPVRSCAVRAEPAAAPGGEDRDREGGRHDQGHHRDGALPRARLGDRHRVGVGRRVAPVTGWSWTRPNADADRVGGVVDGGLELVG